MRVGARSVWILSTGLAHKTDRYFSLTSDPPPSRNDVKARAPNDSKREPVPLLFFFLATRKNDDCLMSLKQLTYQGLVAAAGHSFAHYSVACRQDEGHRLPATASASDSEPVCGWTRASALAQDLAGRGLKDTGPAEPGRSLQIRDAEPSEHALGHLQVGPKSRLGRRQKKLHGLH